MECKQCKGSWNGNIQLDICPFCGAILVGDKPDMTISDAIRFIIQKHGKDILQSHQRLISLVMDYVKGQDREKKLFKIACQHLILYDLYEILIVSDDQIKKEYVNKIKLKLEYDAFLSQENANKIINIILDGLNVDICLDTEDTMSLAKSNKNEYSQEVSNNTYDQFTDLPSTWTEMAKKMYVLATVKLEAYAQFVLGRYYCNGEEGVSVDIEKAIMWFYKSAEQGYEKALFSLGICYEHGYGVEKDLVFAVKLYHKAAMQGYAEAQYMMGMCYESGIGVNKDFNKALIWYLKAARQGIPEAQFYIGTYYYNGEYIEKNLKEAVRWFQEAAEQGCSEAQACLGCCYEYGEGVVRDLTEAVKLYQKAAEQGDVNGQFRLALCYTFGTGVPEDVTEALYWHQKAAEQGYAEAQFALSLHYLFGYGIEENHEESIKWCSKAAEQGFAEAQLYLGNAYKDGTGIEENIEEAIKWYRLSAQQGIKQASDELRNLGYGDN